MPAERSFSRLLQPHVDLQAVAGVVVGVADTKNVLALESAGFADLTMKTPMRTDAMFWIASMTKPMTGVAIMMLVDEGKLSLDDPIDKYCPEYKHLWMSVYTSEDAMLLRRPPRMPTVREIMCHCSGMHMWTPTEHPLDTMTIEDAIRAYALMPLHAAPGTVCAYSNMGINTAGRIIEVIAGMHYAQFMDERIFHPLGMKDTTFWPSKEQISRLASAYRPNAARDALEVTHIEQLTEPYDNRKRAAIAAGGLFSTAADVLRFGQMVLNGGTFEGRRYLSDGAIETVHKKQTPESIPAGFSVGFAVDADNIGHGGALATNFKVSRQHGITNVYMVQQTYGFLHDGGTLVERVWAASKEWFGRSTDE